MKNLYLIFLVILFGLSVTISYSAPYIKASKCAKCHTAIYKEWLSSRHRIAWANDHFKKRSKNYKDKNCFKGCHAPRRVVNNDHMKIISEPRKSSVSEGVSCYSCHVDFLDHKNHFGPLKNAKSPFHETVYEPKFNSGNACAPCHQYLDVYDQFTSLKDSGLKDKRCQTCHMQKIKRRAAKQGPIRVSHNHRFFGSHDTDLLRSVIKVSGEIDGKEVKITLINEGGGHQIPGGIWRTIFVRVIEFNSKGKFSNEMLTEYSIEKKKTLKHGKTEIIVKKLTENSGTVEIQVLMRMRPDHPVKKYKKIKRIRLKF